MVAFDVDRVSPQLREVLSRWFEFAEDGSGALVKRAAEDTDWSLLTGVDGGGAATAHLYSVEEVGACVLAAGSVRISRNDGFSESTMWWLFRGFRDGRFARVERYEQAEEALAAAREHEP
jgi:hypothetical protein